jgi:hypothetical protein
MRSHSASREPFRERVADSLDVLIAYIEGDPGSAALYVGQRM